MTLDELNKIIASDEDYRIERTISMGDMDKFQEAICAFPMICQVLGRKAIC